MPSNGTLMPGMTWWPLWGGRHSASSILALWQFLCHIRRHQPDTCMQSPLITQRGLEVRGSPPLTDSKEGTIPAMELPAQARRQVRGEFLSPNEEPSVSMTCMEKALDKVLSLPLQILPWNMPLCPLQSPQINFRTEITRQNMHEPRWVKRWQAALTPVIWALLFLLPQNPKKLKDNLDAQNSETGGDLRRSSSPTFCHYLQHQFLLLFWYIGLLLLWF